MSITKSNFFAKIAIVLLSMTAIQATFKTTPPNQLPLAQPPTFSSPVDGATNVELSPTFEWNGTLTNATIEIYEGNDFETPRDNLDLNNYEQVLADTILAYTEDLSGITFANDLLYMITNKKSGDRPNREIIITDLEGNIVKFITLSGWQDTEDIVYLGGNSFAIAEEKQGRIYFVDIFPTTTSISKSGQPFVQLSGNKWPTNSDGIEGVSCDKNQNRIYAVDEKTRELHRFDKLDSNPTNTLIPCSIASTLNDLSAIYHLNQQSFDNLDVSDHCLLLSHESNRLIETDPNCNTIHSQLNLPTVLPSGENPKFEGVTMDNQGNIYLVSEHNSFYIYKHKNCNLSKVHTEQPIHQATVNGTSYELDTDLEHDTEYVWRIITDEGCSEFSSFTTVPPPPICNIIDIETTTTCDDNCTPNDPADDTFSIIVSATVEGGRSDLMLQI